MRTSFPPTACIEWAYFLDVDGTLLDIAETPDAVSIDTALLDLIARLYRDSGGAMALVSGRAISDLDKRLGMLHTPLAGSTGWSGAMPPGGCGCMPRRRLQSTRSKRRWLPCWHSIPACCLKTRG